MKCSHQNHLPPSGTSRRSFISAACATVAGIAVIDGFPGIVTAQQPYPNYPFTLGVASGDPAPDGVVLWTRLAPQPLNPDGRGGMPDRRSLVQWEVATDENMQTVVQRGTALAQPNFAHSVHVELSGLEPARTYFYQFRAGDALSPVGRTRTAPDPGAFIENFNFVFASCSDWQFGFFAGYNAMAKEDLDLIVHLGDYIYEYGPSAIGPRQHDGPEVFSLASYRNRHALYKTDRSLQAAHAVAPWLVTWDDHEVENNYADEVREENATPPNQNFLDRRANAYRAYYEHMPLRRLSAPTGPDAQLYRRVTFGDLIEFDVLDTRQYRTDQPCGDGLKPRCAGAFDPSATLLGFEQEAWLNSTLDASGAKWNVLAQQVMMAQFDFLADQIAADQGLPFNKAYILDQWDGYVPARDRLFDFLQQRRPSNPVVITGDIHSAWVHDLKRDFDDPSSETLATELIATSITSEFPAGSILPVTLAVPENPHTKFFDGANRGYTRCNVNRSQWRADFRTVPTEPTGQVRVEEATAMTLASFVIEDGIAGAQRT